MKTQLSEKKRLDNIASYFSMEQGFNSFMNRYRVKTILEHCKGKETVLDLGCADGIMAKSLSPYFKKIVGVDGSEKLISHAQKKYGAKNIRYYTSLIEDFTVQEKFDVVLLSFILEHVIDPVSILKTAGRFLNTSGNLFIMVPNALSLHRRVGQAMGLLKNLDDLNATDIRQGHRRVFTIESLSKVAQKAGFRILETGTFFIKPLSNSQMEKFDTALCDAFFEVSKNIPGLGSMIYMSVGK